MVYIYSIICLKTDKVIYVGRTKNTKNRFSQHIKGIYSKTYSSLKKINFKISFEIIEVVDEHIASEREKFFINYYLEKGNNLINMQKKSKDREAEIIALWNEHYIKGETQITPIAESIAKAKGVSLSTVKRIVKAFV